MNGKDEKLLNINMLLEELYSYSMHGIKLGLENIKNICNQLGNPQENYKVIHIAGTNGKGSTSTILETILLKNGYKVGKYTSPHILRFNERIRANGYDINDEEIAFYYNLIKKAIEKINVKPTFFEVTTAMMFQYFSDKKLDYVILETGLGGRFDATNVTNASISVITNVDMEHTEYLGNTIYDIAKEKAGIIKNCQNIIVGSDNKDFLKAINEGRTKNSELINVVEKYKSINYSLDFDKFLTKVFIGDEEYILSLFGDYQVNNFLCAYEAALLLGIDKETIKEAVTNVVWQCRFEKMNKDNQMLILDGAHNLNGIQTLVNTLKKGYSAEEIVVITSSLKDKDVSKIIGELEKLSNKIIITSIPNNPRGLTGNELLEIVKNKRDINEEKVEVENNIINAYNLALSYKSKVILICGSFYLLGLFKEKIFAEEKGASHGKRLYK
ncbi:bifunctional folylpolyglutamate synthase/dihydrofolate synthase [Fusobacterium sp. PH5-44]|uniref:bifunctional folylpolyglutamate synthase/dihydrofolate synthase n=1 Tax=unclassified Fusobacterium TaxID=2648384 RepID=UPI003D1DE898